MSAKTCGGICLRIKICGITRPEDAAFAEACGADAIGVVLFSDSPRSVSPERARDIFDAVGPFTTTVAVTHTKSEKEITDILEIRPDALQISHPFPRSVCGNVKVLQAMHPGVPLIPDPDAIIVDESHGTGKLFSGSYFREVSAAVTVPVILAGGLNPGNVRQAIRDLRPYAVDVASGVEDRPGIKNHGKVREFIRICREEEP